MVPLPPIVERRVTSQPDAGAPVASRGIATTVLRRITLTEIPTTIPPIDLSAPATPDPGTGVVDFGPPGSTTLGGRGIPAARDTGSGTWNASETLMRVISVIRPRYPEPLRNAGVSGHVLVQFVVDTTGRVEPRSAKIIESTHDLFSRAVLDVVGGLRFRPTEVNGRKVRALAEMPFEFVLK
jgi:protein TonB